MTNQITIKGVLYDIISIETPADVEADGRPSTARKMRAKGCVRTLMVKRPNAKFGAMFYEFDNGKFVHVM